MKHFLSLYFIVFIFGCDTTPAPDPDPDPDERTTDETLYDFAKSTTGYVWYKKSDLLLPKSSGSGHTAPLMRTRFNATASAKLDAAGKVQPNATFPDGSVVVKELVTSGGDLSLYAILYKKSGHPDADAKGWVWGYINPDGSVRISASQKGAACISCHTQSGNIDYVLMNKFFP
ncbi:MAG TPA: cytochrome P460 family protein [Rhodothermales bacterium]|nr:cytochrome P460 family protein [Rhodothermales bacterium]HRR07665.1 cytochrome P460 family protein [Rhodothermales bacterium]